MFYVVIEQLEKWRNLSLLETKRELMEMAYLPGGERERKQSKTKECLLNSIALLFSIAVTLATSPIMKAK